MNEEYKQIVVSDQSQLAETLNREARDGWRKSQILGPGPDGRLLVILSREEAKPREAKAPGRKTLRG